MTIHRVIVCHLTRRTGLVSDWFIPFGRPQSLMVAVSTLIRPQDGHVQLLWLRHSSPVPGILGYLRGLNQRTDGVARRACPVPEYWGLVDPREKSGEWATELVQDRTVVGLGTGSTADWTLRRLGERIREGLQIRVIPTSRRTEALAVSFGIPQISITDVDELDLTIDGADEIDPTLNLMKGGVAPSSARRSSSPMQQSWPRPSAFARFPWRSSRSDTRSPPDAPLRRVQARATAGLSRRACRRKCRHR
jgi:hypothetical protein